MTTPLRPPAALPGASQAETAETAPAVRPPPGPRRTSGPRRAGAPARLPPTPPWPRPCAGPAWASNGTAGHSTVLPFETEDEFLTVSYIASDIAGDGGEPDVGLVQGWWSRLSR